MDHFLWGEELWTCINHSTLSSYVKLRLPWDNLRAAFIIRSLNCIYIFFQLPDKYFILFSCFSLYLQRLSFTRLCHSSYLQWSPLKITLAPLRPWVRNNLYNVSKMTSYNFLNRMKAGQAFCCNGLNRKIDKKWQNIKLHYFISWHSWFKPQYGIPLWEWMPCLTCPSWLWVPVTFLLTLTIQCILVLFFNVFSFQ